MSNRYKGTLMVVASAAGFATLAIFLKFAYAAGANTTTILAFRFLLAALLFWGIIRVRRLPVALGRKTVLRACLLGGIGYGTMSTLFASTVKVLPASLAGMLLYTYPAQVTILSFALGDERVDRRKAAALAVCFAGLWLVLDASFEQVSTLGITLGLAAAMVYSLYIVVGNRLLKQANPLLTTTFVCTAAGFVFLAYGLAAGEIMLNLTASAWLAIAGIALLATVVAILGFFAGMAYVGATNASIISTVEPVITVILSALLLGETISVTQALGGGLILAGVLVLQWQPQISGD